MTLAHSYEIDRVKNRFIYVLFRKSYHAAFDLISFISEKMLSIYKVDVAEKLGLSVANTEVRYLGVRKLIPGTCKQSRDGVLRIASCSHVVPIKELR